LTNSVVGDVLGEATRPCRSLTDQLRSGAQKLPVADGARQILPYSG
jgi:hypothetical protein